VVKQRDPGRNPIFDVGFVELDLETGLPEITPKEMPTIRKKTNQYENRTSKFDMTLYYVEAEEQLHFTFEYSTCLFEKSTISEFVRYYLEIADYIINDKYIRLKNIEITNPFLESQSNNPEIEFEF
jgi:hypothetical protein